MSTPARRAENLPATFAPEHTKHRDAKADAVIAYAKRVKDWPLLEEAVRVKLDEQAAFVAWWRTSVPPRGGERDGAGRPPKSNATIAAFDFPEETR